MMTLLKDDCPWEAGEIEHCPAFLESKNAKHFRCSRVDDCENEITRKVKDAEGLF